MKIKCSSCGTDLILIEVDKSTFVNYNSFIYQCQNINCNNKDKYGDLVEKECTDCKINRLKQKGMIDINKVVIK